MAWSHAHFHIIKKTLYTDGHFWKRGSSLCNKRHTWPLTLDLKSQREIVLTVTWLIWALLPNLEQQQQSWRGFHSLLCSKAVRRRWRHPGLRRRLSRRNDTTSREIIPHRPRKGSTICRPWGGDYAARPAGGVDRYLSWALNAKKIQIVLWAWLCKLISDGCTTGETQKVTCVTSRQRLQGRGFQAPALNTPFSNSNCDG